MAEGTARASRLPTAAALAVVLAAFAARFHEFLLGGTLYRRDAGFFFVPWRILLARLLRAGEWPVWNDWTSGGRPFAADPNAAVFWPLSPLVVLLGPTGLALANVALLLLVFLWALRRRGSLGRGSGFGDARPPLLGSLPAASRLHDDVRRRRAAASRVRRAPAPGRRGSARAPPGARPSRRSLSASRRSAASPRSRSSARRASAPSRSRRPAGRARLPAAAGALALGLALAAVQVLPAAAEVARSARSASRPEHGALFWSVRPSRLLTLLEPRLTGDAVSGPNWGAGTFDASAPYFDDLALGVLPLLFAAAAWRDARGRAALAVAGGAAVLSFGRFLPGYGAVARALPIVRYPEKWWLLATFALATAAAVGVDAVFFGEADVRERARRVLLRTAAALASFAARCLACVSARKSFLEGCCGVSAWARATPLARPWSAVLRMPLLTTTATLLVCAAAFSSASPAGRASTLFTFKENPRYPLLLGCLVALLFLGDAARRVAGTCPAGPPDLYRSETPEVALVRSQAGDGRFYDDGADDRATVERRTREARGLDLLRPATGAVFGIRYLGDNDIDRMTPEPAVRWSAALAALPWGEEKARLLRGAGVSLVRTAAPAPDPVGVEEIGRFGPDRLVRIAGARPEFALLPEGEGGSVTRARAAGLAREAARRRHAPGRGRSGSAARSIRTGRRARTAA